MLETAGLWGKRADMIVRGCLPYNAEPPPAVLAGSDITPINAFYVRNHGPVPDIAPQHWRLTVGGLVDNPLTVTYERLTTEFDQHCVVATLACAGNRRAELLRVRQIPGKEPWAHGAISTAQWCGVRLADILQAADVHIDEGLHVAFDAPDVAEEARPIQPYGSSIPLSKALSPEVLLAWQMNSEPLPRAHGGPVRVVVPGFIGARSVKWVTAITVQPGASQNYFQALDYRILPADADADIVGPGEGISLSSLALNCDILDPTDGDDVPAGALTIRGYGMAGDGRSVERGLCRRRAHLAAGRPTRRAQPVVMAAVVADGRRGAGAVGYHRTCLGRYRGAAARIGCVPVESARIRQQRLGPRRIARELAGYSVINRLRGPPKTTGKHCRSDG